MADENTILLKIKADSEEAVKKIGDIEKKIDNIKPDAGGVESFFSKVALFSVGANQALELFKKAMDFKDMLGEMAKAGEAVGAIQKRFEILAEQNGLNAEHIEHALEKASNGTVVFSELMQKASASVIELGKNAGRLDEIFTLSKKAAAISGGDTLEMFDKISTAIASRQARALKSIGIQLDENKVLQEYASKLGVTKELLTASQQQQAFMNAALEQGNVKYKNVNASLTPLAVSMKQANVQAKELTESLEQAFNKNFGAKLKQVADNTAEGTRNFREWIDETFLNKAPSAERQIEKLNIKIKEFGQMMTMATQGSGTFQLYRDLIIKTQQEIDILKVKQDQVLNSDSESPLEKKTTSPNKGRDALDFEGQKILNEQILAADKELFAGRTLINEDFYQRKLALHADSNATQQYADEAVLIAQEETKNRLLEIEKTYQNVRKYDVDLYNQLIVEAYEDHGRKILAINKKITESTHKISVNIGPALAQAIGSAVKSMTKSLMEGKGAFASFGDMILKLVGEMATQVGTVLVSTGIGMMALEWNQPAVAIAAGIGLIAIGQVLSALGGGGDASASSAGAGGGGGAGSPDVFGSTPSTSEQRATPTTGVQVVVQGNILNTRESALEIAKVLNDSFDTNGTFVRATG